MEVCLDFETSIPVCSHRNLFLHLSCTALNTERSVHWAFENRKIKKTSELEKQRRKDHAAAQSLLSNRRSRKQDGVPKAATLPALEESVLSWC